MPRQNRTNFAPKSIIATIAAAALAATGLVAGAGPATAQGTVTVNQGDRIYIEGRGACTVAYIDPATGNGYTSAHCGHNNAKVHLMNQNNTISNGFGRLHQGKSYNPQTLSNDWAVIHWGQGIRGGKNVFSGDRVVDINTVKRGDRVCYHGKTSHGYSMNRTCGTYVGANGPDFMFDATLGQQGDSGGPVWVEGRGLLGAHSGSLATALPNNLGVPKSHEISRGSVLYDGPVTDSADYIKLVMDYVGYNPWNSVTINGIPAGSAADLLSSGSSSSGSGAQNPATVIGILMAIISAVGLLGSLAQNFL
ncbi:trypsin-like serine protease [Corynebacterium pilosum]|uniref:Putative secreted protein n=1 Tax=Corynebacterium pilosum TaxID=35756 RepID=A0A376CND2_9CORY|nr:trypsin-like serine protease [Corynebacterium pilosum]STC69940.1 putative secreted protein [Corynebacterium pilosum]